MTMVQRSLMQRLNDLLFNPSNQEEQIILAQLDKISREHFAFLKDQAFCLTLVLGGVISPNFRRVMISLEEDKLAIAIDIILEKECPEDRDWIEELACDFECQQEMKIDFVFRIEISTRVLCFSPSQSSFIVYHRREVHKTIWRKTEKKTFQIPDGIVVQSPKSLEEIPKEIWLHRQSIFKDLGKYDPGNGNFEIISWENKNDATCPETVGFYEILADKCIGFYRIENVLFLFLHDYCIPWSDDIEIELGFEGDYRHLVIKEGEKVLASYDYPLDTTQIYQNDPTPFIKAEDFDFGLFLLNIANDPGRKLQLSGFDTEV